MSTDLISWTNLTFILLPLRPGLGTLQTTCNYPCCCRFWRSYTASIDAQPGSLLCFLEFVASSLVVSSVRNSISITVHHPLLRLIPLLFATRPCSTTSRLLMVGAVHLIRSVKIISWMPLMDWIVKTEVISHFSFSRNFSIVLQGSHHGCSYSLLYRYHSFGLCFRSWNRMNPYLIGLGLAFFYSEKGGAKRAPRLHVSSTIIRLGWIITSVLLGLTMFGTYGEQVVGGVNAGDCKWNHAQTMLWLVGSNLAFSCAIAFIIWAGLFGYGGWLTRFLANDFFCPWSRLVYGAYLVHLIIISAMWGSSNRPQDWFVRITVKVMHCSLKTLIKLWANSTIDTC